MIYRSRHRFYNFVGPRLYHAFGFTGHRIFCLLHKIVGEDLRGAMAARECDLAFWQVWQIRKQPGKWERAWINNGWWWERTASSWFAEGHRMFLRIQR